jgi:dihydroxyacetone kinase-like predicted kinase
MSLDDRSFGAGELRAVLQRYAVLLENEEHRLNVMNVFPTADADTGTNLKRTVAALLAVLSRSGDGLDLGAMGAEVALAAESAAVGNSGRLLTAFLAGMLRPPTGEGQDRPGEGHGGDDDLGTRLAHGAAGARSLLGRPVEGTMVTVGDAVAAAVSAGGELAPGETAAVAERAHRVATETLIATPSQLSVLAVAGVLDAGAAGLVLFFRALADVMATGGGARPPAAGPAGKHGDRPQDTGWWRLSFLLEGSPQLADGVVAALAGKGYERPIGRSTASSSGSSSSSASASAILARSRRKAAMSSPRAS